MFSTYSFGLQKVSMIDINLDIILNPVRNINIKRGFNLLYITSVNILIGVLVVFKNEMILNRTKAKVLVTQDQ